MIAFNLAVSAILGVCGVVLMARGNMAGLVLIASVILQWTLFFERQGKPKK